MLNENQFPESDKDTVNFNSEVNIRNLFSCAYPREACNSSESSLYRECILEKISSSDGGKKNLYSDIEHLIIIWNNDGTRTAGSLAREIMDLLKNQKKI